MKTHTGVVTITRKKSKYHVYQRKRVECPKCGSRLMDESIHTSSELRVMEDGVPWEADYYSKCQVCKAEIGVKKIK